MDIVQYWRLLCCCAVITGFQLCTYLYLYQTPGSRVHEQPRLNPAGGEFGTEFNNNDQVVSLYRNICQSYDPSLEILQPKVQLKSLVLVITLNNPMYEVLPLVELIYRPLFPNIVYCISNGDRSREPKDWNMKIVYYTSPPGEKGGLYNYICVELVHRLGLKADGYLVMSDDILVAPSAVARVSKQHLPVTPVCGYHSHTCTPNMPKPPGYCKLDPKFTHLHQSTAALKSLRQELKQLPQDSVGPRCDRIIQRLTGVKDPLVHCLPDIFYIPAPLMEDASVLFRQFYNYRVFHGAAVYHTITCLASPFYPRSWRYADIQRDRHDFTKVAPHVVTKKGDVVHPVKLSPLLKGTPKYGEYFCNTLLPFLHNDN